MVEYRCPVFLFVLPPAPFPVYRLGFSPRWRRCEQKQRIDIMANFPKNRFHGGPSPIAASVPTPTKQ